MNQSEHINDLAAALAKAQGEIKNPQKNKTVHVRTKTGGSYEFQYADLTAIIDAIKEPLSKNGLSYIQTIAPDADGKFRLTTRLMHGSGQWIESITPLLVDEGGNQPFGSALTFMKRYALAALIGVAADSDDDANAADGNQAEVKDRSPREPKEPAPSPMQGRPQPAEKQSAPHAIRPVPLVGSDVTDWAGWGKQFLDAANASQDEAESFQWLSLNQASIHKMQDEAPKVFARLVAATKERYDRLLLDKPNILSAG